MDYLVNVGMNYPPEKRAEAGDTVSDLPAESIPWLLEQGHISDPNQVQSEPAPIQEPTPESQPEVAPEPTPEPVSTVAEPTPEPVAPQPMPQP